MTTEQLITAAREAAEAAREALSAALESAYHEGGRGDREPLRQVRAIAERLFDQGDNVVAAVDTWTGDQTSDEGEWWALHRPPHQRSER